MSIKLIIRKISGLHNFTMEEVGYPLEIKQNGRLNSKANGNFFIVLDPNGSERFRQRGGYSYDETAFYNYLSNDEELFDSIDELTTRLEAVGWPGFDHSGSDLSGNSIASGPPYDDNTLEIVVEDGQNKLYNPPGGGSGGAFIPLAGTGEGPFVVGPVRFEDQGDPSSFVEYSYDRITGQWFNSSTFNWDYGGLVLTGNDGKTFAARPGRVAVANGSVGTFLETNYFGYSNNGDDFFFNFSNIAEDYSFQAPAWDVDANGYEQTMPASISVNGGPDIFADTTGRVSIDVEVGETPNLQEVSDVAPFQSTNPMTIGDPDAGNTKVSPQEVKTDDGYNSSSIKPEINRIGNETSHSDTTPYGYTNKNVTTDAAIIVNSGQVQVDNGTGSITRKWDGLTHTSGVIQEPDINIEVVAPVSLSFNGGIQQVADVNGNIDTTLTQDNIPDGITYKQYSTSEKTKLSGISPGATANNGTVTNVSSADSNATVSNASSTPSITIVSAPKLQTARTIGALTGDVTTPGSNFDGSANNTNTAVLATVNSNVGTFGSASKSLSPTVDAKGRITAITEQNISITESQVTGLTADLASKSKNIINITGNYQTSGLITEEILFSQFIAGGVVTSDSNLILSALLSKTDINAGTVIKVYINDTNDLVTPVTLSQYNAANTAKYIGINFLYAIDGTTFFSTPGTTMAGFSGPSTNAPRTGTWDISLGCYLIITATNGSASDTVALKSVKLTD